MQETYFQKNDLYYIKINSDYDLKQIQSVVLDKPIINFKYFLTSVLPLEDQF